MTNCFWGGEGGFPCFGGNNIIQRAQCVKTKNCAALVRKLNIFIMLLIWYIFEIKKNKELPLKLLL